MRSATGTAVIVVSRDRSLTPFQVGDQDLLAPRPAPATNDGRPTWVIDLDGRRAVTHRDPRSDGYADVAEVHTAGALVPTGLTARTAARSPIGRAPQRDSTIGAVSLADLLRAATASR